MPVLIQKKKDVTLKENKVGCLGGLGEKKGKGELIY